MKHALVFLGARYGASALLVSCAAGGPKDVLDGTSHDVRSDAGAASQGAYAYVAKRPLVAIGLAGAQGLTEDDAHRVVDRVAEEATACFKRASTLTSGAAHITLPIDEGGITGAPQVTFSPPGSAVQGMICILAPMRLSTFAPGKTRSLTIEAAWGNDLAP